MFKKIITHSQADWEILKLANDKGKFAIEMGEIPCVEYQMAFERGIDGDWFKLVDIGPVVHAPGRLMRVFKLTPEGLIRRKSLIKVFGKIDA